MNDTGLDNVNKLKTAMLDRPVWRCYIQGTRDGMYALDLVVVVIVVPVAAISCSEWGGDGSSFIWPLFW